MPINLPNGNEVDKIVLPNGANASQVIGPNGQVVWEGSAIPDSVVDNFEDADADPAGVYESGETVADYYVGATGDVERSTTGSIFEGAHSLESVGDLGSSGITSYPGDGLNRYPKRGDEITAHVQVNNSDDTARLHLFAEAGADSWNEGDNYSFSVHGDGFTTQMRLSRLDSGTATGIAEASPTISHGKWYRIRVTSTSTDLTFDIEDPVDDSVVETLSATDDTYSGDGFGWSRRYTDERFDLAEVV